MILIDGQPGETITVHDRGFNYGDGLFETIAVFRGEPVFLRQHLNRLAEGCRRLGIPPPDPDILADEVRRVAGGAGKRVVKIIVTRGSGGRGYRPPENPAPHRVVAGLDWPQRPPEWWRDGVAVRICRTPLGCNPALAGLKQLGRLEQVTAAAELADGEAEGLMIGPAGQVVEGTMSNLFLVQDGTVHTPELSGCGVAGIVRGEILARCAELGIGTQERVVVPAELFQAEEIFLTNSLIGIWPVRRLAECTLSPGSVTARLMERLRREFPFDA